MSRLKVKCANCGKIFTPANAKQTLCTDCERSQRAARAQKRAEATTPAHQSTAPLIQGPGASVLRPGMAHSEIAVAAPASGRVRANEVPVVASAPPRQADAHVKPKAADAQKTGRGGAQSQPNAKKSGAATPPFALTDELRQRIEERYLALANPVEFDGIRTQIAAELGIAKPAVRAVVRDLRARRGMSSWWEVQGFAGSQADLERIRSTYTPYLPLPPVGIHRQIAESLGLEPRAVYRGIRKIRAQMGLPQYNAPDERGEGDTLPAMPGAGEGAAQPAS
jgi:hypothetical protein